MQYYCIIISCMCPRHVIHITVEWAKIGWVYICICHFVCFFFFLINVYLLYIFVFFAIFLVFVLLLLSAFYCCFYLPFCLLLIGVFLLLFGIFIFSTVLTIIIWGLFIFIVVFTLLLFGVFLFSLLLWVFLSFFPSPATDLSMSLINLWNSKHKYWLGTLKRWWWWWCTTSKRESKLLSYGSPS